MKKIPTTRLFRTTLIALSAVAAMTAPIYASASTSNIGVAYEQSELDSVRGQKKLYFRLQNAAQKLCGSSDVRVTGSLRISADVEACYNGTLEAAVERLNSPAMMALHSRQN